MLKNPDFEIEEYWFNLKNSMNNFYKNHTSLARPIDEWSNKLNILQDKKKYIEIEKKIRDYISLYGIDCMRVCSDYNMQILKTNIKRWNKLSKLFNFDNHNNHDNHDYYYNIIFLLIDIYDRLPLDKKYDIYREVELIILYKDFNNLIEVAVNNNKGNILDKLKLYKDITHDINNLYNIECTNKISGLKVIKMIKNNKNN
jgi:hypothetical protein